MRVGVVNNETWAFLTEIYEDLEGYYPTSLFSWQVQHYPIFNERLNRLYLERKMGQFLRQNDVVFFEWSSELLSFATQLPKQSGIVTRLHRYEMYDLVKQINWDAVDKIILVSQAKKREFLSHFPDQASKIEVIFEAVDPDKFPFHPKPFSGNIGILCHLTPRKRVYELVLAFYELAQIQASLHLHVGGGPQPQHMDYFEAIQDLVKALSLQEKVTFYDHVTEPSKWYQNIDIFISNSYSEGLQVAPMEAMASGCYCLSHHWNGAEELLPEPYLYYTDRQMQEKILAYCETTEKKKLQEKEMMRSIVCEKFNIHHTKEQIRSVIASVGQNSFGRNKNNR